MEEAFLQLAKNDSSTKGIIVDKIKQINDMNVATKAELATQLLVDAELVRAVLTLAGDTINDLSIENEVLEEETTKLKSCLTEIDRDKINAFTAARKKQIQDSNSKNERILREVTRTMQKAKQLTQ